MFAGDGARTHQQLCLLPVVTEVALERRAIDLHVVVEQPDEFPLRLFDPSVACGGEPTVLLPDRLQIDGKGLPTGGDQLADPSVEPSSTTSTSIAAAGDGSRAAEIDESSRSRSSRR